MSCMVKDDAVFQFESMEVKELDNGTILWYERE